MKSLAKAWGIGWLCVVLLAFAAQRGIIPQPTMQILFFPGLFAADLFGYGAHDGETYLILFIVASIAYGAVAFTVLWLFIWRGLSKG